MKKLFKLSIVASMALSSLYASEASSVKEMFSNGEASGQVRLGYYNINPDSIGNTQTATAIGGQLKFETASLHGFSVGTALYTSQTIDVFSGDQNDADFSDFLASSEENYTEVGEAYINYNKGAFNIRIGRQLVDTPLADSDDIAMTPNTFEAVILSYTLKDLGLTIIGANVQRMQGVDTGYTNVTTSSWMDTGDSSSNMLAILYANDMIESSAWYYDVKKAAKAIYVDASMNFAITDESAITVSAQYLNETESDASNIDGSIAGIMAEASFSGLSAMVAYNELSVSSGKTIFEGFGGGSSYTNMHNLTAGTLDTDAKSFVASVGYEFSGINIFTAYGDFEADSANTGHLTEIDAGISYEYNNGEADISLVYVNVEDKLLTNSGSDEIKVFANYNF